MLNRTVGTGQCVALPKSQGFRIAGNARDWGKNAILAGYKIGQEPKLGAIAVTRESSYGTSTGHVTGKILAIVGKYVYVQEQNYVRYTVTEGWLPMSKVVTYIYPV